MNLLKDILDFPAKLTAALLALSTLWNKAIAADIELTVRLSALIGWTLLTILLCFVLPRVVPRLRLKAHEFYAPVYWERLKICMRSYEPSLSSEQKSKLEKEYNKLRGIFLQLTAVHEKSIMRDLGAQGPGSNVPFIIMNDFRMCFSRGSLQEWAKQNGEKPFDSLDEIAFLIRKHSLGRT